MELKNLTTSEAYHNINRIKTDRVFITNSEEFYMSRYMYYSGPITYNSFMPGLHRIVFNGTVFIMNVPEPISGNDSLVINSRSDIHTIINGRRTQIVPYRLEKDNMNDLKRYIYGTLNCAMDGFVLCGESNLTDIPYPTKSGVKLNSTHDPCIVSKNLRTNRESHLPIKLPNNIKSLPSGVHDVFVVDTLHKKAYILFRVARVELTGNEIITQFIKENDYTIFLIHKNDAARDIGNSEIQCNYFPSITFGSMGSFSNTCGVALANDTRYDRGIYVKIPHSVLPEASIMKFKQYLSHRNELNPVVVEYKLEEMQYRSALLDEYCAYEYYPEMEVWTTDASNKVGYFVRSINKITK